MKRTIAAITTSRADYGHLYWTLRELHAQPDIDLKLIVVGPHLSPAFGNTIEEIERDGFEISEKVECLLSSDTDVGMAKTIGVATISLADILGKMRPDILLIVADRYEMLAPASVALALRIPIAHIEGGEVSEGAIDDAVRNALTKMSHIHLTPTEDARRRVIAMGEESWRVHSVGALSLDHLKRSKFRSREQLERELELNLNQPTIIVTYHPVTLRRETTFEANSLFAALDQLQQQIIFCYPNADAGSYALIDRAKNFCETKKNAHLFVNLNHVKYWSLLRLASVFVGNSSSGIMETPSLELPTVNVGIRQRGRMRARNILDAEADSTDILAKINIAQSESFRASLAGLANPYGDGHAAEKITEVLKSVSLDERLLIKRVVPLNKA